MVAAPATLAGDDASGFVRNRVSLSQAVSQLAPGKCVAEVSADAGAADSGGEAARRQDGDRALDRGSGRGSVDDERTEGLGELVPGLPAASRLTFRRGNLRGIRTYGVPSHPFGRGRPVSAQATMVTMQIRIDDPNVRDALATAFAAAGCPTLPDGDVIEVVHPDPVELTFFVRAWAMLHPDVSLEIV